MGARSDPTYGWETSANPARNHSVLPPWDSHCGFIQELYAGTLYRPIVDGVSRFEVKDDEHNIPQSSGASRDLTVNP
ncbi:hypothetical protein CCYS_00875 [Corynebacterium cystitidis DSM 20524]|uniref:Uncharacterized protein n=1 Tax=Corynebacterium cystitidis DSM 20524 TaxID=1121357 RepID=A0A1H9U474_9CORY|nr:hypothetical protein CCYS_00875 [Corynebacterium cystitidis DSM 20524]SES04122.1 hypothetical protein SAMN05661109_01645 [Corynebacterium cystitidis DSM 20524]SNV89711.1 Uncharacterised protein [Corynebacterium cystitidis]